MSTEVLTQTLQAGVKATFGAGSMFLIASLTNPVNIVARQIGNSNKNRTFTNVPAGFKFTADIPGDGFDTLEVTSGSNQQITIAVGTDDVSFSNAVTVSGSVSTQDVPAGALTDTAPKVCATGAQTNVVPANGARRRVMLTVDPAFVAGTVYARAVGGAQSLIPMQAGLSYTFVATYGVDVRNDTGAPVTIYIAEES